MKQTWDTLKPAEASAVSTPKIGDLLAAFDTYCNPKQNETVERYKFFTRNQTR